MTNQLFIRLSHAPSGFRQPHELSGLPPETPLLVAFSGGADSRLLLHLAVHYREVYGTPVYAAHLHHGIRGAEADRDEAFCRQTAEACGVTLFTERVDVPAMAALHGQSLELAAREARYAFLGCVMREQHIPLLLTAHHADDQLETLLLRLLRGTGTRGMAGIPPIRPLTNVANGLLIRPLLGCTRADVLHTCQTLGLTYVTDSTNEANDCTRNRLRHEVIPALQALAGEETPAAAAARLARAAREDDDCLTQWAEAQVTHITAPTNGLTDSPEGGLSLAELNALPPAISRRVLAIAYARHTKYPSNEHSLETVHLDALLSLCRKAVPHSATALPGGLEGRICGEFLCFGLPPAPVSDVPCSPLALFEGENVWDDGHMVIDLRLVQAPIQPPNRDDVLAWAVFPADALPLPLWARRRRPGDVLHRHGVGCKLKKLLCDQRVPPDLRDRLPLICTEDGNTPLWFPTAGFADGYPPPANGAALLITVRESRTPTE